VNRGATISVDFKARAADAITIAHPRDGWYRVDYGGNLDVKFYYHHNVYPIKLALLVLMYTALRSYSRKDESIFSHARSALKDFREKISFVLLRAPSDKAPVTSFLFDIAH